MIHHGTAWLLTPFFPALSQHPPPNGPCTILTTFVAVNKTRNIEAAAIPSYVPTDEDICLQKRVDSLGILADDAEARGDHKEAAARHEDRIEAATRAAAARSGTFQRLWGVTLFRTLRKKFSRIVEARAGIIFFSCCIVSSRVAVLETASCPKRTQLSV